ncbi:AAA family ATPase [Niveispirillum sp. BGYR6]|uniref:AAA family ATPase n=1 Tax=Niveispirillum sp. BGYR6 TaxID=2971249 RepID=UPI0022B97D33|nr:AAA family ATPase [Niveispirillum sp. BGYR6]MDG5496860.1 AAA family ATPase [Niveispirillum sp. BGYR6]
MGRGHIGLTGSAGTGKTTLGKGLAARLDRELVAEAMRARLMAGFDLHQLTREGHRALLLEDATSLARRLANPNGPLLTDRTPLDMAAFWLANGYGVEAPAATEALLARAICAMADYERVILLPWGALPLADDGIRSTNPWMQLHFQTILEGLCRRYVAPERLVLLPETVRAPADRLGWVLGQLDPKCLGT